MFRRFFQSAAVTLAIGSSAFAADFSGDFTAQTPQGPLQLSLHEESGRLTGIVHYGSQQFSIAGDPSGDHLTGCWASPGGAVPFSASISGAHLVLNTNGVTCELQKDGSLPNDSRGRKPTDVANAAREFDKLVALMPPNQNAVDSVHWNDVVFTDNSGSVSVPDGWQIVGVHNGCPGIFGPHGEIVGLGQRLTYSSRQVPYRGPVESAKIVWTQFSDTFNPPVRFVQIIDAHDSDKTPDGGESADIRFVADVGQAGQSQRMVGHMILMCSPPDLRGNWKGIYSVILAPQDSFEAAEPIMSRVWNSWQLNSQQVYANAQQQAVAELSRFRGQLAANAAQFANTSHTYDFTGGAVAAAQRRMNTSGRQVEDWCNTMGGTGYAQNNQTGALVPLGPNTAADLNHITNSNNYSTFHVTPNP